MTQWRSKKKLKFCFSLIGFSLLFQSSNAAAVGVEQLLYSMSLKVPMMMKRSTAINSKQALMSDHSSCSSHFPSPVLFMSFSDAETSKMEQTSEMSPTSILEIKSFSATKHQPWDLSNSKTVGLRILDDLIDEKTVSKPVIEFGVKNKSSQLAMASLLSPSRSSPEPPPPILCLSATEMEKSEDYTRVVSHGPNPRTTHIFDTWIMENCGNGFSSLRKEIRISMDGASGDSSNDFLAFCNACKKNLGEGDDIFMFRRETVFCSNVCRNEQMLFEDRMENSSHCGSLSP